jgi:glutathione synthase/RimK-type ligase-like ATP-grasp enzyme
VRIALATCADLPAWEVDDRPLHAALGARGVEVARPAWDDPAFDWGACAACLIRTTWDYMERREEFVAWAERTAAATRVFNPAPVVRRNTHKSYLRELEAAGVPTVPTAWLAAGSTVDLAAELAGRGWRRAFLKPAVGATARETLRFAVDRAGLAAARRHLARTLPREDMLLQPYLGSVETAGERSAIFIDGAFSHAVRKVPVPGDYRVQDDFGAEDRPVELTAGERRLARAAVAAAGGDLLYARVDLLADDRGRPRLSELELVEPSLFFRHHPAAAERLAGALLRRLGRGAGPRV